MRRLTYRKIVNNVMLTLTGVCTLITVSALFVILGYLVVHGAASIDWAFLTQLPKPTGETGGGMANAIVGSAAMVGIAAAIGLPVGFLGGIYLAEYSGKLYGFLVRYTADLLNGVPSIVIGIFAWTAIVVPMHTFSALAGGFALSLMLIPITMRSTEQFLLDCAALPARGRARLGRAAMEGHRHRGGARRHARYSHRNDSRRGAHRRRNRAAALHRPQQRILAHQPQPANSRAAGYDL